MIRSQLEEFIKQELSRRDYLPVYTPHHARGDAFTTAQLFLALATRLERAERPGRPLTVRNLCAISRHHSA